MKNRKFRIVGVLLAVCVLLGCIPVRAYNPGNADFLNTYVNTGNQREDIIGVALTQIGYREKGENDTKYGDWYGLPSNPWCAMFVSWCARQADISTDILQKNAWAHPRYFDIPYYHGSRYTPKPGDLFFTDSFEHTGLVWYVDGEFFYTIEGNANEHAYNEPVDPNEDSYFVVSNKRLIREFYFGVPSYEGCDKEHDYVKGQNTSHPHKTYYKCRTCGDQYYTGYTEVVSGCSKCFSCGCSSKNAGYYRVKPLSDYVRLRGSHNTYDKCQEYIPIGSVVYVHGIHQSSGWAFVEYDGIRGHIPSRYLEKYPGPPAAPTVTTARTEYTSGTNIRVSWDIPAGAEQFRMTVLRDGEVYLEKKLESVQQQILKDVPKGNYEVRLTARNMVGESPVGTHKFLVRDVYTLTYDPRGGSGAPESQSKPVGDAITVSKKVPVREGYTFLGWELDPDGSFAQYDPGDTLRNDENLTLYAVWKSNEAVPKKLTVGTPPERTMFLLEEELDTTGLVLNLTYSDGSGHRIWEGYSVGGYDPAAYGSQQITVTYGELTTEYPVEIVPYIPGDLDDNRRVNRDDVMLLLWHISFPERFPVDAPSDFTEDEKVNRDDVIQLLWHITFPEQFPLEIIWPEPSAGNRIEEGDAT